MKQNQFTFRTATHKEATAYARKLIKLAFSYDLNIRCFTWKAKTASQYLLTLLVLEVHLNQENVQQQG